MMKTFRSGKLSAYGFLLALAVLHIFTTGGALAQISNVTNDQATPMPGVGHDYIGTLNDLVNPSNGSLSIRIPIPVPPGRGVTLPLQFSYNSAGNIQVTSTVSYTNPNGPQGPMSYSGSVGLAANQDKRFLEQGGWGYGLPLLSSEQLQLPGQNRMYQSATCPVAGGFVFSDPSGARHALGLALPNWNVCNATGTAPLYTPTPYYSSYDGSYAAWTTDNGDVDTNTNNVQVLPFSVSDNSGTYYHFSGLPGLCVGFCNVPDLIEDRNGNQIKIAWASSTNPLPLKGTDTAGRQEFSIPTFGSASGDQITIGGLSTPYKINWESVPYNITIPVTPVSNGASNSCPTGPLSGSQSGTMQVVGSIELPNHELYKFDYDTTYGLLRKITYPTGAYIAYTWGLSQQPSDAVTFANSGLVPAYPNQISTNNLNACVAIYRAPVIVQRVVSFDGANVAQTQDFVYSTSFTNGFWATKTTTVKTTDSNRSRLLGLSTSPSFQTVYTYSPVSIPPPPDVYTSVAGQVPLEKTTQYYDFSGNLARTVSKTWGTYYPGNPWLAEEDTALPNGQTSKVIYQHDSYSNVTEKDEYDYGQSSPARTTTFQYQFSGRALYSFPPAIYNAPCKTITYAGSTTGTRIAELDREYDGGTTVCGTSGTSATSSVSNLPMGSHDEVTFGPASTVSRGNLTTSTAWGSGGASPSTTYTYDETGQMTSMKDPCGNTTCADMPAGVGHTTTYSYADSPNGSVNTNAYLTQITRPTINGVTASTKYSYDYDSGLLASTTDENGQTTSYTYADPFNRLTKIQGPLIGASQPVTSYSYNDSTTLTAPYSPQVTETNPVGGTTVTKEDGLGHTIMTQVTSAPSVTDDTATSYDGEGLALTISNPYRDGTSGASSTTFTYDALGRRIEQLEQDGSSKKWWCYNGVSSGGQPNCNAQMGTQTGSWVDVQDEGSSDWQQATDGLGRLIHVLEPNGTSSSPSMETDYTYDLLDNLTQVDQWGGGVNSSGDHKRLFRYDSLSRLIAAQNPESNVTCYGTISASAPTLTNCTAGYDANGNLMYKTDARAIRTTYTYDARNRMTTKSAPGINYTYFFDKDPDSTVSSTFLVGRLAYHSNNVNAGRHYSYDPMGRTILEEGTGPSNVGTTANAVSATYDLSGGMTSMTYPDGRIVNFGRDTEDRIISATDITNSSSTIAYESAVQYSPSNDLLGASFGNGATLTQTFDTRLRVQNKAYGSLVMVPVTCPKGNTACTPYTFQTQTLWSKGYSWTPSGNLQLANDNVLGIARQYTYDTLNRVLTAQDIAGSVASTGEATNTQEENEDNDLSNPQQLGLSGWTITNASHTNNSVLAPDNTMTASAIVGSSGSTDSWAADYTATPTLYDGSTMTGSVWLRVPSGTLSTYITIVNPAMTGVLASSQPVNLTTTWQQFTVSASNGNGLTMLGLKIGGTGTIGASQEVDVWGPELTAASASTTNILPSSQQLNGSGWSAVASGTLTPNSVAAPDGTSTGSTMTATATSTDTSIADYVVSPSQYSNTTVTASVYLKLPSGSSPSTRTINLYIGDNGPSGTTYPAVKTVTLTTTWERFDLTGTTQANLTYLYLLIGGGYSVQSGQSVNIWGAQMVTGTSDGTYVATTSTTTSPTGTTEYLAGNGLNEQYSYDAFGNLKQSGNFAFQQAYTTITNQLDGWNYDASGNLLTDPVGNYTYDSNGMISADNSIAYYYDAMGNRVGKGGSTPTDTIYFAGKPVARLTNGVWTDLIYGASGLVAENTGGSAASLIYRMTDPLGSSVGSLSTSPATVLNSQDYAPFGQRFYGSGADPYQFTGKERDTESGLDYFGARYYGSNMGRWMSPDLVNVTEDRMMNPSSTLNKYAYGANNPLKYIDPDGQDITYFYDQGGFAGHAVLFAYNQANGNSAIESFGPASTSPGTRAAELTLFQVPSTSMFDMSLPKSADDLRSTYAAITIQTSPELTQQVIDYIKQNPDPSTWGVLGPNCSSEVWKILRQFKLAKWSIGGGKTPRKVWNDLYSQYVTPWNLRRNPSSGKDYGQPRSGLDMFNLMWNSLPQSHEKTTSTIINWKPLPDQTQ